MTPLIFLINIIEYINKSMKTYHFKLNGLNFLFYIVDDVIGFGVSEMDEDLITH